MSTQHTAYMTDLRSQSRCRQTDLELHTILHDEHERGTARETARRTLWGRALGLVLRAEAKLRKRFELDEIDPDMVQEGNLAAGKAVETWDPSRGAFSTWIIVNARGAMLDYLNERNKGGVGSKSSAAMMVDMEEGVASSPELGGTEDMPGMEQPGQISRGDLLTYEGIQMGPALEGLGYVPAEYEDPERLALIARIREVIDILPTDDGYILKAYFGLDRPKRTLEELADDTGYSESGIRKRVTLLLEQVREMV